MSQAFLPGFEPCIDPSVQDEETTKQRSTVETVPQIAKIDSQPIQAALPDSGVDDIAVEVRRPTNRCAVPALVSEFHRRVRARNERRTATHYRWLLLDVLKLASSLAGRELSIEELLLNRQVLGQTLSTSTNSRGDREVSSWHAAQRRSVLRSFVQLMDVELRMIGIPDAAALLTSALRSVAVPVGSGFRLPVGTRRNRGGPAPTAEEIRAIREVIGGKQGWRGVRDELFLNLLARRGQRITGLLELDGARAYRLPGGSCRFMLRAKSAREPYELVVPDNLVEKLEAYIAGFNSWSKATGLTDRIGFGVPGMFWRNDSGRKLTHHVWSTMLKEACAEAGVAVYTSHAFRRAFATIGSTVAPRPVTAVAGNWTSTRRMDDHYIQPSLVRLRSALANLGQPHGQPDLEAPLTGARELSRVGR